MTFNLLAFTLREVFEASKKGVEAPELADLLLLNVSEETRTEYNLEARATCEQIALIRKYWQ